MKRATILSTILLVAVIGNAQTKVLIPIWAPDTPGAHGSIWHSELWLHNDGDELALVMRVDYLDQCRVPTCSNAPISPGSTAEIFPRHVAAENAGPGGFLYVHWGDPSRIRFSLRTQDLSRQALTFGTEIPVVREADLFTSRLALFPVPTDARFRQTLRIYDFDARASSQVRVRFYDTLYGPAAEGNLLLEEIVTLAAPVPNLGDPARPDLPERPAYAQLLDLVDRYPVLGTREFLSIVIEPLTPGLRFWAFVSVTNDETQHVTTVTPN